jgi:DNA polymerase-3 subunit epsilon/ATP-dependent DNA helicase DinG
MTSIVSIDIETTGLDPKNDTIIEIGAVKFNGHRVEEEWATLINPGKPIPPMITNLTHITNDMVRNSPKIRDVIQDLAEFVGDCPVLGHNIRFDLSFLQRYNILGLNDVIDTYELASVLMPTASRYNLTSLGQQLGVINASPHRALADAQVTHKVYARLFDIAMEQPIELIAEFVRLSEPFDWDANWMFSQVLKQRSRQPIGARQTRQKQNFGPLFAFESRPQGPGLNSSDNIQSLDPDEVASLLEHGGPFSKYFGTYEQRPEQVDMLRSITKAFSEGQHLMVEAGTGTGKSFAYLVPSALWATVNNQRVVISTNTINLQEQLINKDIPDVCAALNLGLRAIVLKGRSNYLCPRRLETLRQRGPENVTEMRILAKILIWLQQGGNGDRTEINVNGADERDAWMRLSAEDEGCRADVCVERTGGACPFYQVRQAAQVAHLLIVNHALLLSDVATGGNKVLPEYNYLIVDEGHHLEAASTDALSFRVTKTDLARLIREMGGTSSGILGRLLSQIALVVQPSDLGAFHQLIQRSTDLLFRLDHDLGQFFYALDMFLTDQRDNQPVSPYGQQLRIIPSVRTLAGWSEIEISWDQAHETFLLLINLLTQLNKGVSEIDGDVPQELEDHQGSLATLLRRLLESDNNINALIVKPEQDKIYWVEIPPNSSSIALQMAPLHVGSLMEHYLWHQKQSIVVTSATLTTHGEFDYIRSRLNADEANELALGSPFDYQNSSLLYLVNDIPEPNDANNYQRSVETALIRLSKATGGRLLALFTSYAQLKRTSQGIAPELAKADIEIYEQGLGASSNTLVENFRGAERAILLGTRSFWEGVDIPGEALSVLVIVKLPFDVPSDPIIAARSETFDDPFNEYSLPEAILRFRQGFGRLIRTQSDRGIVVILDKRILTKRYGRLFIESLPDCSKKIGGLADLPMTATKWLGY